MAEERFITSQGKKELEKQLAELRIEMAETIKKIKEAREFGDLSENAEYDAAKTEQAQIDAKIYEIEQILRNAKIIDDSKLPKDTVSLGSTVCLSGVLPDKDVEYKIVGTTEADPDRRKLSDESPLGRAILGAKKGDVVVVKAPAGSYEVKIVKIN